MRKTNTLYTNNFYEKGITCEEANILVWRRAIKYFETDKIDYS